MKVFHSLIKVSRYLDCFSERTGRFVSWLVIALVLLISYDVAMRYLFQAGSTALQELEWHLFSLIFLLGAAYTLKHDGHVRVDVLYHAKWMSAKGRAWIDLFGSLFFLIPFCILIIYSSWPFVLNAYEIGESSPDPGGLPYRFLLKAAIPLGFALLILQGLSMAIRSAVTIVCEGKSCPHKSDSQEV